MPSVRPYRTAQGYTRYATACLASWVREVQPFPKMVTEGAQVIITTYIPPHQGGDKLYAKRAKPME